MTLTCWRPCCGPGPDSVVAVPATGAGEGMWAGAPSALRSGNEILLAYRLRDPARGVTPLRSRGLPTA